MARFRGGPYDGRELGIDQLNRAGHRWGPERVDVTGRTVARGPATAVLATALHRETIEDMIAAWVGRHPPGFVSPPGRPDKGYVLADAAVEVVQPGG
jgi:hypothetical protein